LKQPRQNLWSIAAVGTLSMTAIAACSSDAAERAADAASARTPNVGVDPRALDESTDARARVAELRCRFRHAGDSGESWFGRPSDAAVRPSQAVIGEGVVSRFELAETRVRPELTPELVRRPARTARVTLPSRANDAVRVDDDRSHRSIAFTLVGTRDVPVVVGGGIALYANAYQGVADVVHRVSAEGTEDYVVFERPPASEALEYTVDVSNVAGLRLVSNALEFLDERGTPALRVPPPFVVGADGARHEATLAVVGCEYDSSAAAPWGREITRPRASSCAVSVRWDVRGVAYPAIVDPAWNSTGSMVSTHMLHTATLLANGKVLIVGGRDATSTDYSAELFDPTTATFAATGFPKQARFSHTATLLPSGQVLVAGGEGTSFGAYLSSAEVFDPTSGTFASTGSMSARRAYHTATLLASGIVLVAGGANGTTTVVAGAELFDPKKGTFSAAGSLVTARGGHTATVLGSGKVLVAGGNDGSVALSSGELFDPTASLGVGRFTATGAMARGRTFHSSTYLPSGKVLVSGGVVATLAQNELFDPAGAGTFSLAGLPVTSRQHHIAVALPSGGVLLVGGSDGAKSLSSAELSDAAGAAFKATKLMAYPRQDAAGTLLGPGTVLVAGGQFTGTGGLGPTATAEVFTLGKGAVCTSGLDCDSGLCDGGICCAAACSPSTCMKCVAGTGACAPVLGGDDPDTCTGKKTCDAAGACTSRLGETCAKGADCVSGLCVDSVCCNTSCDAPCDSCNVPGSLGTCVAALAGATGSPACPGSLLCDGASPACPTSCTGDAQCSSGNQCNPVSHACVGGSTCDGAHTTTSATGAKQDCSPYTCDSNGTCRQFCASQADCVGPTICNSDGRCTPGPVGASDSGGGGCAIARRGAKEPEPLVLGALLLGLLGVSARARARRGRRSGAQAR
jgi:hypothetical protein